MLVTTRDLAILDVVSRFSMLPSGAIQNLIFHENKSNTSCDRALQRLVARKYLARVERRLIGGNGAGSGQYVYKLGVMGKKIVQSRRTARLSDIHHTVAIADAFIDVKTLERQGLLELIGYATEPDSWRVIGSSDVRPDLILDLGFKPDGPGHDGYHRVFFVEVDLGNERQKQLKEKMKTYSDAWKAVCKDGNVEMFPIVLFLVPDDDRVKELKWIASQEEDPELFQIMRQDQLADFVLEPLEDVDVVALTTT